MAQGEKKKLTRNEVERAARVYRMNKDAWQALGISDKTFVKLCHRYGVVTPAEREKRRREEWPRE